MDNIQFSFKRNNQNNQIELVIDYGENNLEGASLRFNIDPTQTNFTSVQTLPVQNNVHLKLNSQKAGSYFFGYSQEIYDIQRTVSTLS